MLCLGLGYRSAATRRAETSASSQKCCSPRLRPIGGGRLFSKAASWTWARTRLEATMLRTIFRVRQLGGKRCSDLFDTLETDCGAQGKRQTLLQVFPQSIGAVRPHSEQCPHGGQENVRIRKAGTDLQTAVVEAGRVGPRDPLDSGRLRQSLRLYSPHGDPGCDAEKRSPRSPLPWPTSWRFGGPA